MPATGTSGGMPRRARSMRARRAHLARIEVRRVGGIVDDRDLFGGQPSLDHLLTRRLRHGEQSRGAVQAPPCGPAQVWPGVGMHVYDIRRASQARQQSGEQSVARPVRRVDNVDPVPVNIGGGADQGSGNRQGSRRAARFASSGKTLRRHPERKKARCQMGHDSAYVAHGRRIEGLAIGKQMRLRPLGIEAPHQGQMDGDIGSALVARI